MEQNTHGVTSARLCGTPRELAPGSAVIDLTPGDEMRVDNRGLVHGGFLFGLADYAAMLAVNHPNVVLGSAEVRFIAPVVVGEALSARAVLRDSSEGKRRLVDVDVTRAGEPVFRGTFTCFVPAQHVLDARATGAP